MTTFATFVQNTSSWRLVRHGIFTREEAGYRPGRGRASLDLSGTNQDKLVQRYSTDNDSKPDCPLYSEAPARVTREKYIIPSRRLGSGAVPGPEPPSGQH